jgi:hypothetical protein
VTIAHVTSDGQSSPDGQAYDVVSKLNEIIDALNAGTATPGGTTATSAELNALHSQGAVAADFAKLHAITRTAAGLNADVVGVAAGYRVARGVAAVTGTATVVTGLTTVVAVVASAQDDLDGDALAGVSATVGNQSGAPAAGSVILKCWKATADGDATLIAATAAKSVGWIAVGT